MTTANFHKPEGIRSFTAGEALAQYRIVIINSSDPQKVEYPAAIRDTQLVGITLAAVSSGEPVSVATAGYCLLEVDGNAENLSWGDSLMAHGASGLGQKVTTGGAGNVECIGFAEGPLTSTADGDIVTCRISKHLVYFAS